MAIVSWAGHRFCDVTAPCAWAMSRGSPTENYSRFRTSDRTRQALLVGARDRTRSPAGRGRRSARADPVIRPIDRATVRRRKSAIKSPSRAFVTTGQVTSPEVCTVGSSEIRLRRRLDSMLIPQKGRKQLSMIHHTLRRVGASIQGRI